MINCIIVDDEQHAIDLLSAHISKVPLLNLQFATTRSIEAFQYIQRNSADLIFLDIQMPELGGIQLLKLLKGKSKVILTTAYSKYALEGYEHDIVDYLLKPIVFERFLKAVQKAIDIIIILQTPAADPNEIRNDKEFIFVKTDGRSKMVQVMLKDIEYIEARGNYVSIHTPASKIITLLTIKELEEKLPVPQFIRIHNSFIISVKKISQVEGNLVQVGKQKLPVGDVYKKSFLNTIEKYIVKNKK